MKSNTGIRLTRAQVREVDRRAIEQYGIPGIVLMENAGRNAADLIRERLPRGGPVGLVCGRGNNGGDGFVIARHLHNAGIDVELFLACDRARLAGDAATNYRIVERMSLTRHAFDTAERINAAAGRLNDAEIVVDAVLGTGFSGDVRSPLDLAIAAINQASATIVAVDLPSGLDCDTGRPSNATVRADLTITFVARKVGLDAPAARDYAGDVIVADIGAPHEIIRQVLAAQSAG